MIRCRRYSRCGESLALRRLSVALHFPEEYGIINAEMNAWGIGVMRRTCKACGNEFGWEYHRGRPREYCYVCQPPGTRMIGAVKLMNDSPDLRPALAYLKAVTSEDHEAVRVLTEHGDLLELVEGLADLLLLFIGDLSSNPSQHVDLMFKALEVSEGGNR
jgi:hypothetical protein